MPGAIEVVFELTKSGKYDMFIAISATWDNNEATMHKIALNLLKKEKSKKISVKVKRLKAAWDTDFLLKVLGL